MGRKRPLLVGLTGSIGMGKSETAQLFARLGIPVHDADAVVHRLYDQGGAAVPAIRRMFPDSVVEGRVERSRLAQELRRDPSAFAKLEAIVHPLVARDQKEFVERAAAERADIVVLDIPLLFESGRQADMDAVVVVSAPGDVQRARVLARPGMSEEALDHILARQMPDVDKRARAHFVVETGEGIEQAFEQVKAIVSALREGARKEDA